MAGQNVRISWIIGPTLKIFLSIFLIQTFSLITKDLEANFMVSTDIIIWWPGGGITCSESYEINIYFCIDLHFTMFTDDYPKFDLWPTAQEY